MSAWGLGGKAEFLILLERGRSPSRFLKQNKFRRGEKKKPQSKTGHNEFEFLAEEIAPNNRTQSEGKKKGGGGEVGRKELLTAPHNGINEINRSN